MQDRCTACIEDHLQDVIARHALRAQLCGRLVKQVRLPHAAHSDDDVDLASNPGQADLSRRELRRCSREGIGHHLIGHVRKLSFHGGQYY